MPNYDLECPVCETLEERNVPMEDRDEQYCDRCYHKLIRRFTFRGSVWAPTSSNGATHK
jgi:putative FmdB family regulatory protein